MRYVERHKRAKPHKDGQDGTIAPVGLPKPLAGRNKPCPCGSGKKFKNCHMDQQRQEVDNLVASKTKKGLKREPERQLQAMQPSGILADRQSDGPEISGGFESEQNRDSESK